MDISDVKYLDAFEITIDPRAILHIQGYDVGHEPKSTMMTVINRAIEETLLLARPRALYCEFPIAELTEDSLLLHDGTCFSIGARISSWWKGTRALVIAVCTIGGELERRLGELSSKGEYTAGLNLDIAGSVALASLGDQVHHYICRRASDSGMVMGPFVNPGYREWPLTDQKLIFGMLPASSVGVALNEQCMMVPKKSITFCSGIGVSEAQENFNRCKHCAMARCSYRRASRGDEIGLQGIVSISDTVNKTATA